MARKRGGLAGIWDRNKKVIKPIAEIGASLLGGPMASAGIGALMEGLDRPGKSGIGFDAGAGLRGGIQGYGVGQGTQLVKGGAKALMSQMGTGATAPVPKYNLTGGVGEDMFGAKPMVGVGAPVGVDLPQAPSQVSLASSAGRAAAPSFTPSGAGLSANPISPVTSRGSGLLSGMRSLGKSVAESSKEYPKLWEMGLSGINNRLGSPETRAMEEKNMLTKRQLDLEERQYNEEQERRKRIAQLLLPMYQQMAPKMFGQTTP
jgi:hypothetical protein